MSAQRPAQKPPANSGSPYRYPAADWVAREDPQYPAARPLAPRIPQRAAEMDAARQIPRDLVLDIANAGLFKVALSDAEGGFGADVLTTLRVIEEVARAEGSTGWCLAMGINSFRQSA